MTSAGGRGTQTVQTPMLFGNDEPGGPAGVKDLKSITDPAAGSEARRQEGPEAAHAFPGLSR